MARSTLILVGAGNLADAGENIVRAVDEAA